MITTFVEKFGSRRLSSIDRLEARAWAQENPSRARVVRAMLNDAIDVGLITQNPFARLGLEQSRGRRDLVVLSEEELSELADHALEIHGEYGP